MPKLFEYTATGRYFKVYKDDIYVSQHTTEREAIERANEQKFDNPDADVTYVHEYEVQVGLTDAGVVEAQDYTIVDNPPIISSTPAPIFLSGTPGSYDMTQHVTDDGISAVTYGLSNTLPNGLVMNPTTGILSYDGAGAESVSSHQLTATDAVGSDQSAAFNVEIAGSAEYIVTNETEFDAALAAIQPGETMLVRSGTYDRPVVTTVDATEANPITIKKHPDDPLWSVVFTGFVNIGDEAMVHFLHDWWTIGEGIKWQGDSTNAEGQLRNGNPDRMCMVDDNVTGAFFRGYSERVNARHVSLRTGVDKFRLDLLCFRSGTADNGQGDDSSDGIHSTSGQANTNGLVTGVYAEGGHACYLFEGKDCIWEDVVGRNDFRTYVYQDQGVDRGNRIGSFRDCDNLVVRRYISVGNQDAVDTVATQVSKMGTINGSCSQFMAFDASAGGPVFTGTNVLKDNPLGTNCYFDHVTAVDIDGGLFTFPDNQQGTGQLGPNKFKNIIVKNLTRNPGDAGQSRIMNIQNYFASQGVDWRDTIFIDGLVADQDYNLRIQDKGGAEVAGTGDNNPTFPLTWWAANFPDNFKNITIVDPNFINETLPDSDLDFTQLPSDIHATVWAEAQANFVPQASAALAAVELAVTTSAVVNSDQIPVDDGNWFRGPMGWDHRPGDLIYIEGWGPVNVLDRTGNNLTVSQDVTCADGAKIWRGGSANPRMGATL